MKASAFAKAPRVGTEPQTTLTVVTISRQAGIDAGIVARALTDLLNAQASDDQPWKSYDRQLTDRVAQEHRFPIDFVASHDEHDESIVEYAMHGLSSSTPAEAIPLKVAETIRHLADVGHAIIVGRGGQSILSGRDYVIHVRLIAPEDWRAERHSCDAGLNLSAALKAVRQIEADRVRYVRSHFNHDPTDPLMYHAILNLAELTVDQAARTIAQLVHGE